MKASTPEFSQPQRYEVVLGKWRTPLVEVGLQAPRSKPRAPSPAPKLRSPISELRAPSPALRARPVDVGLALATIRDERLYREEFATFEDYCRIKWQDGRSYVDRLISAAQDFRHLATNCHQTKPDCEGQVRPLIGLTPDEAELAWECEIVRCKWPVEEKSPPAWSKSRSKSSAWAHRKPPLRRTLGRNGPNNGA